MAVPRDLRQRIEKGDLAAVESAWLEHVADAPHDLDWFAGVARRLAGSGHGETARTLLEVLADELSERALRRERLDLLRAVGEIAVAKTRFHDTVLDALRAVWSEHPELERALDTFGLRRAPRDPADLWDRVSRLESVLRFAAGSIVWVEGHGPGRIAEVNLELEGFKIEVDGRGDVRVGFRAAAKLLKELHAEHFVVLKMEAPERLRELRPPELLERILRSFDRPVTAAEIKRAVEGLVPAERWTSWWAAARRHPQVVASADVRNAYVWVESSAEATSELWRQFESSPPAGQIDLLRRAEAQDPALLCRMVESLRARALEATGLPLALEIALALERFAPGPELDARAMVAGAADPARLIGGVAAKSARARAYELVRCERDDWAQVHASALLAETDPALLGQLAETLGRDDETALARSLERAVTQPAAAPAFFTWIAERAGTDERLRTASPLRLWKRILSSLGRDELQPFRKRLVALADSGGTLPRLLAHVDASEAADALDALRRATALPQDRRRALEDAVLLRFPELRETEEPLWALPSSIEAKREELRRLLEEEIPRNRRAIEEARALGDLRENFEYKAARQRHEYLASRAEALAAELARSKPVDLERIDVSRIGVGTSARLRTDGGVERIVTVLGPWESAPESDVLSYQSDVGRELLGRRPGDEVDLGGTLYRVLTIQPASA